MKFDPVSRSLVAVDIEGYSRRGNEAHLELRDALRAVRDEAFSRINVKVTPDQEQDQGDAFLMLVGPEVPKSHLVDDLIREFSTALARFNRSRLRRERMRLRIALHAGEVHMDGTGFGGEAVIAVMRLIDADSLREALKGAPDDIAVIVSDQIYRDVVVQRYRGINPADYRRVQVARKTFRQPAWIRVPGLPLANRAAPGEPQTSTGRQAPGRHAKPAPTRSNAGGRDTPSPSPAGGVQIGDSARFQGPTSFGGHAAGGNVNIREAAPRRDDDA